jgi:hypothetical protein
MGLPFCEEEDGLPFFELGVMIPDQESFLEGLRACRVIRLPTTPKPDAGEDPIIVAPIIVAPGDARSSRTRRLNCDGDISTRDGVGDCIGFLSATRVRRAGRLNCDRGISAKRGRPRTRVAGLRRAANAILYSLRFYFFFMRPTKTMQWLYIAVACLLVVRYAVAKWRNPDNPAGAITPECLRRMGLVESKTPSK